MTKMIFKKISVPVLSLFFSGVMMFSGLNVSATNYPDVTTIPNVETSVPQTTQATQASQATQDGQGAQDNPGVVTDSGDALPYDQPVTDDDDGSQSILDALNVGESNSTIDLVLLITILSLAPSILVMMTCFTRIIISFSLLRNALGVQQTPPNQVLIGLALFLTFFVMSPVITDINEVAYQPYKKGEMSTVEAVQAASVPLKEWMLENTSNDTMDFFLELSGSDMTVETEQDFIDQVSFTTVVPAFILSEIKIGFEIGFLLYIPFLIIDMVVSTVLMSMGMMMLPPSMISMPFKILMFILVDGWQLLAGALVSGFN